MAECGYRGCAALRRLAAHDHRNPCVTCWTVDEKACCRYRSLGIQISLSASDRTTWSALQHTLAKVILTAAGGMLLLLCHRHEGQRPAARACDGAAGRRAGRAWRRRNNPSASRCCGAPLNPRRRSLHPVDFRSNARFCASGLSAGAPFNLRPPRSRAIEDSVMRRGRCGRLWRGRDDGRFGIVINGRNAPYRDTCRPDLGFPNQPVGVAYSHLNEAPQRKADIGTQHSRRFSVRTWRDARKRLGLVPGGSLGSGAGLRQRNSKNTNCNLGAWMVSFSLGQ